MKTPKREKIKNLEKLIKIQEERLMTDATLDSIQKQQIYEQLDYYEMKLKKILDN